jgi:hypothetical protein
MMDNLTAEKLKILDLITLEVKGKEFYLGDIPKEKYMFLGRYLQLGFSDELYNRIALYWEATAGVNNLHIGIPTDILRNFNIRFKDKEILNDEIVKCIEDTIALYNMLGYKNTYSYYYDNRYHIVMLKRHYGYQFNIKIKTTTEAFNEYNKGNVEIDSEDFKNKLKISKGKQHGE